MLPGVSICTNHGIDLLTLSPPAEQSCALAMRFGLPQHCSFVSTATYGIDPETRLLLANLSMSTLTPQWPSSLNWREIYRTQALKQGYHFGSKLLATAHLSFELRSTFGDPFLKLLNADVGDNYGRQWPALLLRSSGANYVAATPKHICLATFLSLNRCAGSERRYQKPGKKRADYESIDREALSALTKQWQKLAAAGVRATLRPMLIQTRLYSSYRHHPECFPRVQALLHRFRQSAQSERQLGRRTDA